MIGMFIKKQCPIMPVLFLLCFLKAAMAQALTTQTQWGISLSNLGELVIN